MDVKIYTTATCPKCKILKQKLDAKGVQYEELTDIEYMASIGIQAVPWLEVKGKMMNFMEANGWINNM